MQYPDARILVFCKAPVRGQVNTRLISHLGTNEATRLHEELARRMISVCIDSSLAPVQLWCAPDASHPFFRGIEPVRLFTQRGANLGARMANALAQALADSQVSGALLVGTDCPAIDAGYLERALKALETHDAVLGPAEDGGYGLIGMREAEATLFTGIDWGSAGVCAQTARRLNEHCRHWALLPAVWDVDRPEDVARYRREFGAV